MAGTRLSALSTEYIKVSVRSADVGKPVDPILSGQVPQFAFKALGANPVSGDWKNGEWERFTGQIVAKCLLGPGGVVALAAGEYAIWLKFVVGGETPIMKIGSLTIE